MRNSLHNFLKEELKVDRLTETEVIQSLWSGYGKISRWEIESGEQNPLVAKHIVFPEKVNHPRGWNTDYSHQRKLRSYEVEMHWYKEWNQKTGKISRTPNCYGLLNRADEKMIILEDIDHAGFGLRKSTLNIKEVKVCLEWLAGFHATFMNNLPTGLWENGTYWHLATRPDELKQMENGKLKEVAYRLDEVLSSCKYQTILHGDAKVANFCFSPDITQVAAVDFQYAGGGCGMKDLVYFMGSCLSRQHCEKYEEQILDYYFSTLKAHSRDATSFQSVEKEWRYMYAFAWADFMRFLKGWMPNHQKINAYSEKMINKALKSLY